MYKVLKTIVTFSCILIMVILFRFNTVSSKASDKPAFLTSSSPIVVEQGTDLTKALTVDGYFIAEHNIDKFTPGEYSVTYQAVMDASKITKKVVVVDKEESSYVDQRAEYEVWADNKFNTTCIKSITFGENGSASVFYYNGTNYVEGQNTVYLKLFDGTIAGNPTLITVQFQSMLEIVDLIYDNGTIVVLGNGRDMMNGNKEIFIFYYNISTKKNDSYRLGGKKDELVTSMTADSNYYYVAGSTTSSDGAFTGVPKDHDSVIVKIDKKTMTIVKTVTYHRDGNDRIESIYFQDGYLYSVSLITPLKMLVLKNDIFFNLQQQKEYNYNADVEVVRQNVFGNMNTVALRVYNYQAGHFEDQIITLNENLLMEILHVQSDPGKRLVDYSLYQGLLITLSKKTDNSAGLSFNIYQDNNLIYRYENHLDGLIPTGLVFPNGSGIIGEKSDNKLLQYYKLDYLLIQEKGSSSISELNKVSVPVDYAIIINGRFVSHHPLSKLTIESLYGTYKVSYFFHEGMSYLFEKEVTVEAFFGAIADAVHDTGLRLYFNGRAYLNDVEIENGHELNESGMYTLRLVGKDLIQQEISFTVAPLTLKVAPEEETVSPPVTAISENAGSTAVVEFIEQSISYEPNTVLNWYYLFPFGSLIAGFLMVVLRKE